MGHRDEAAPAARQPTSAAFARRAPVILVVDDQRAVRVGVGRLLATIGHRPEIHHAADRAQALAALERHSPDLVVLDVDLDGVDGLALLRQLCGRTRVLVLTSHADAVTRSRAATLGASALVGKHEAAAVLLRRVAELLRALDVSTPRSGE